METLSPVLQQDPGVARRARQGFLAAFEEQIDSMDGADQFTYVTNSPETYRLYGIGLLDRIMDHGIIDSAALLAFSTPDQVVTIVKGDEVREQILKDLYTPEDARELLADSLPYSRLRQPEFIYPLLIDQLRPNLSISDSLTQRLREQNLSLVPPNRGLVEKGELIISKGSIITEPIFQKLRSFEREYEADPDNQRTRTGVFLGYVLLTALLIIFFFVYLRYFFPVVYGRLGKLIFVLMWIVLYAFLTAFLDRSGILSLYLLPFCIVPIVVRIFFDERLAFFTHIVTVMVAGLMTSLGFGFTFLQIMVGIVVILMDVDLRDWSRFFRSLLYIFFTYALGYLGLELIKEGRLTSVDWNVFGFLVGNVFLTLLAFPLIPLLERVFGFVSPITLAELADMNRPLLRELSLKAPGTLQHSLQVGNLSEAAARRIGANSQLVRTAALYHDIGKINNPQFFIENNPGPSPHDGMDERDSAQIILAHVTDGVVMAKKAKLPTIIIDFIRSHHGTTRVEYFYRNYLKKHPGEEVDEADFRYAGPRPVSKEETIMMLADSTEAACKSLKNPTADELYQQIDDVFDYKLRAGQLENSRLSFSELEVCRQTFRSLLMSVYHVRIQYPEEEE